MWSQNFENCGGGKFCKLVNFPSAATLPVATCPVIEFDSPPFAERSRREGVQVDVIAIGVEFPTAPAWVE